MINRKPALILGVGGMAAQLYDYLTDFGDWDVQGFVWDGRDEMMGLPVYDRERPETIPALGLILAMSNPVHRQENVARFGPERFLTVLDGYVSPSARVGRGSVILGDVNVGCRVGDFVYLHQTSSLEYDGTAGDYCFLGPRMIVGGGARIGRCCCLGMRVTVAPGVTLGDEVTVGMGAVITADVAPGLYVSGNPAVVKGPTDWGRW